jgi:putative hydrolase
MPLFQKLAEPIAEGMANALGENLGELLPEEFAEFASSANSMLRRAGASLFALQLGSALGQFAQDALVAGEVGIPISERPGVVIGNALLFSRSNGLPEDQVLLYLALRELALHSLFTKSTWLRDQVVNQVREYAAGLRIDAEQLRDFAANASEISGEELAQSLSAAGLIAQRSEGQLQAMERIEFMVALIEGWVESTAQEAGARLPALPQISEAIRRRRAVGGIGEKTFETLLGLELRPRLLREAAAMWVQLNERIGRPAADQLWSHPDLLPSPAEVIEPEKLVARLRGQEDELDKQLRDLLD